MREALPIWVASRIAVALIGLAGAWVLHEGAAKDVPSWLGLWQKWDANLFVKVAQFGYPPTTAYQDRTEVDFPAMPLALRLVHVFTGDWTAAGLIVSLLAGGVAACSIYRLAAGERDAEAGRRAVLYLVCFPYAVFLFAGYSEALFLAFATTGWVFARERRWALASVFVAGASFTRLVGLCLALGLIVQYVTVTSRAEGFRRMATRPVVLSFALPFLSAFSFVWYLHGRTGHWDAYQRAQEAGWGRHTASLAEGFRTVWAHAVNGDLPSQYVWSWRAEMLAVLGGFVLFVVLMAMKRWGEAVFVGTSVYLLAAQNYYASAVRSAIIWFPLYLLLARVTFQRTWLHYAVTAMMASLMPVFVVAFTLGRWIG